MLCSTGQTPNRNWISCDRALLADYQEQISVTLTFIIKKLYMGKKRAAGDTKKNKAFELNAKLNVFISTLCAH